MPGVGLRVKWFGGSRSSGSSYQPETIAFLNAVGIADDGSTTIYGITGNAVWQGVDAFIVGIKADGNDLSKLYMYPYIGGDSLSHSREMLRPTDAALFSTFTASPLQDENGVTFQISSQNALKPFGSAGFLPEFANVIGCYVLENLGGNNRIDLASRDTTLGVLGSVHFLTSRSGITDRSYLRNYNNAGPQISGASSSANIAGITSSNSSRLLIYNEVVAATDNNAIGGIQPANSFNLGNEISSTLGKYCFEWFYQDSMTGTQAIAMQSRIHTLQTVLNRAITY